MSFYHPLVTRAANVGLGPLSPHVIFTTVYTIALTVYLKFLTSRGEWRNQIEPFDRDDNWNPGLVCVDRSDRILSTGYWRKQRAICEKLHNSAREGLNIPWTVGLHTFSPWIILNRYVFIQLAWWDRLNAGLIPTFIIYIMSFNRDVKH